MLILIPFLIVPRFFLNNSGAYAATLGHFTAVSLPLQDIFDNQAASSNGSADFDGRGGSFDSSLLPPGPFVHDGVTVSTQVSFVCQILTKC